MQRTSCAAGSRMNKVNVTSPNRRDGAVGLTWRKKTRLAIHCCLADHTSDYELIEIGMT